MRGSRAKTRDEVLAHCGLIVIEQGVGFEADALLEQISDQLGAVVELRDPDDPACVAPTVAVIVGPYGRGLGPWRDVVVRRHRVGKSTVVLLPQGSPGNGLISEDIPTVLIDAERLRANVDDVRDALESGARIRVDASVAALVVDLGDGWPAWVNQCVETSRRPGLGPSDLVRIISSPSFRQSIVAEYLTHLDPADVRHLAQLAHFEVFSDSAAAAVGGVRFAELVLPHAPGLFRTPGGLMQLCRPVRDALMEEHALDPIVGESLLPVMLADGNLLVACRTLIDAGLDHHVARLLAVMPGNALDLSSQRELLAVLRVIEHHRGRFPALALKQARVHRNLGETSAAIDICEAVLKEVDPGDELYVEASIELLMYRYRLIDPDEAASMVSQLRNQIDGSSPLATMLREAEARVMGQHPDDVSVVQVASDRLDEVASEWAYHQDRLPAARALRTRAAGPLWHFGRYREGQATLERAADLAVVQAYDYGVTLNLKARFDVCCADLEAYQRSIEQARFTVADSGIGWLEGYMHWSEALAAGMAGSLDNLKRSYRRAKECLGEMFDADTGVVLCSEIAVQAARLGDLDFARSLLGQVRERTDTNQLEFNLAEIIVLARAGEVHEAWERWSALEARGDVPNDRRWTIELELGLSDRRAGVAERINLQSVRNEASRLGLSELFDAIAPELSELIVLSDADVSICLLGGVAVSVGTAPVALPPGKTTKLISLLAIEGGRTVVDVVVDHLWPDADLELGQRRLKNVVKKAREALGNDAILRGGDVVELGPRVTTDVAKFRAQANLVDARRQTDPSGARQAAVSALDVYAGPLMPAELYDDRVIVARADLQRRAETLLNYLMDEHEPPASWLESTLERVRGSQSTVL